MLATTASTPFIGDQLWLKVVGPAATAKSTLCEALAVARQHVVAKSSIRGFLSGFRTEDGQDYSLINQLRDKTLSLINQLRDKTLVIKDGDTLLQAPNLSQILAEARDIYDCVSRSHYRNATSREYENVRMTWILCGTSAIRSLDQSELGERFLDCVIMERIDDELEDDILWRVVNRAEQEISTQSNGKPESFYSPEKVKAMRATGGYVEWLRENAPRLLPKIKIDDTARRQLVALGKFVAYMRARPSTRQIETAEREFGARLVSQLTRLAKCLALVLNRSSVDRHVMRRVKRVALDTARGVTLTALEHLCTYPEGLRFSTLAGIMNLPDDKARHLLRFLKGIGVIEIYAPEGPGKSRLHQRWRATERIKKLYHRVQVIGIQRPVRSTKERSNA